MKIQKHHPTCAAMVSLLLPGCLLRTGSVSQYASASPSHTAGFMLLYPVWYQPGVSAQPLGSKWSHSDRSPSLLSYNTNRDRGWEVPRITFKKTFFDSYKTAYHKLFGSLTKDLNSRPTRLVLLFDDTTQFQTKPANPHPQTTSGTASTKEGHHQSHHFQPMKTGNLHIFN